MMFRAVLVSLLIALTAAFKRVPLQMNVGNKIAAAFVAGVMILSPSSSFASDLSVPIVEKRAKFSIGAGIQNSLDLNKRAKFSIGAGIQKSNVLEKRAKFSIGAGIQNTADLEKRAKFSIGAGIQ